MEQAEGVRIQSVITFVVVTGSRDYHRGTDKRRKKRTCAPNPRPLDGRENIIATSCQGASPPCRPHCRVDRNETGNRGPAFLFRRHFFHFG